MVLNVHRKRKVSIFLSCCFTSTEARWPVRDGDRVGRGRQSEWRLDRRNRPKRPWTAARTMEVFHLHCPATCALRSCCFNCCAWTEPQRQCPLSCCWWTTWTTRSNRGPTCSAHLHLPTHDLFWANLKVQLHLPPLRSHDLLISPRTLKVSMYLYYIYRSMKVSEWSDVRNVSEGLTHASPMFLFLPVCSPSSPRRSAAPRPRPAFIWRLWAARE